MTTADDESEGFEFAVSVRPAAVHEPHGDVITDEWSVSLPHQCDDWTVAWGDKVSVAARLRRFIAEAEGALAELASMESCPHEWRDVGREYVNNAGTNHLFECQVCQKTVFQVVDRSTAASWSTNSI